MTKIYGLWKQAKSETRDGYWLIHMNGEPLHSVYPQLMAASRYSGDDSDGSVEVREILIDGTPGLVPTRSDNAKVGQ